MKSTPHPIGFAPALLSLAVLCAPVGAQDGKGGGSLVIAGQFTPLLSGDAGRGDGAPAYDDAFSPGLGAAVEYHHPWTSRISFLVGLGYDRYAGDSHQGIDFSDLVGVSLYGGSKFFLGDAHTDWRPYARLDLGATHLDSVTVSADGLRGTYWRSGWSLTAGAGAGLEKQFGDWHAFGELQLRYLEAPDQALGPMAGADGVWSMPLRLGVGYRF